jgi:transcription antitermination factor NusG
MGTEKKWLAVYTRPRWEKKVNQLLKDKGFETYCPLNKVQKTWSDRVKIVEEPLFKSYVFVKVEAENQGRVRMINGVLNFVYWLGKPAVISEKDIDTIRRFLNEYEEVTAEPLAVLPNQEIRVTAGPFMDLKGRVIKVRGKRVEVQLEKIGYKLVAFLDKAKMRVVKS